MQQMTADFAVCTSIQGLRYIFIIYSAICFVIILTLFFFPGWSQELLIEVKLFFTYRQSIRYSIISIYCAPFCADIIISIPSKFIIIYIHLQVFFQYNNDHKFYLS